MKTSSGHPYRVLIADDQADIRDALRLLLKREGYETQGAQSPAEALAAIEAREFDAVLMDLNYTRDTTSGQEGLDLLPRVQIAAERMLADWPANVTPLVRRWVGHGEQYGRVG